MIIIVLVLKFNSILCTLYISFAYISSNFCLFVFFGYIRFKIQQLGNKKLYSKS